jgi:hypothetical protein
VTVGLAGYLVGTRSIAPGGQWRYVRLLRVAALAVTVCLALLRTVLGGAGVVAVTAAWAVLLAAAVSRLRPRLMRQVAADQLAAFHAER